MIAKLSGLCYNANRLEDKGVKQMKKVLKNSLILAILAMILFALTGCGGDKLVGKKEGSDGLEQSMELHFKDDKIDKMVMSMEAPSKKEAKEAVKQAKESNALKDAKVKASGKKVVITMTVKQFVDYMGGFISEDDMKALSKDEWKEFLESQGYEVK